MKKQIFFWSLGVVGGVTFVALASFLALREPAGSPAATATPTVEAGSSVALQTPQTMSIPLNPSPDNAQESGGLSVQNGQSTGLGVLGANNNDNHTATSSTPRVPGPESFKQYEQYADAAGAMFIDIIEGNGREASVGDTLAVVYTGWLTDGTVFDQSRRNSQGLLEPFVFTLGQKQVITGWEQGLLGMHEGGKRRLVIPAVAGYGDQGQGSIPPGAMLIFDVELAQVQEPFNPDAGL